MTDGVEVGHGYISISASAKDAVKQIDREFSTAMPKTGKQAGGKLGAGFLGAAGKIAGPLAALFAVDKIGDFFASSVQGLEDHNRVTAQTNQVVKTTGEAARISAGQVGQLADAIERKTGVDGDAVQTGANMLLTFTNVRNEVGKGNDIFNQATQTVTDMSVALGQDTKASAVQLGKALNDPVKGVTALSKVGVSFTEEQKKQIKTLVKSGDTLGAQKIILKELGKEFGGTAAAQVTASDKMKVAFHAFQDQIGALLLPLLNKFFNFLTTVGIPALSRLVDFVSTNAGPAFAKLAAFVGPIAQRIGALFAGITQGGAPAASFLRTKLVPAFLGIVSAGQRLAAVVLPIIQAIAREFASRWPKIRPIVLGIFQTIGGIVVDVMGLIRHEIATVTAVIKFIWSRWGKQITTIVGSVFETVFKVIGGVMKIVGGIVKVITGLMTGDWRKAGNGIKQIVAGIKQVVVAIWRNIQVQVQTILGGLIANLVGKLRGFLSYIAGGFRTSLARMKDFILTPVRAARDALQGVLNGITGKFRAGVSAIGRAWDGLKAKAKAPISFIIHTVINGGLIKAFNKLAAILPGVGAIPNLSVPGFHDGGWTGPGAKYQPAGIVHADEFVINKGSRAKIERDAPGLLNQLNGYAGGGLVGGSGRFTGLFASRLLAAQKLLHTQFAIFQRGFRPATSYSGTSHAGDAVDLGPVTARVVAVLRSLGIAAWRRGPAQGFSLRHIHGVPLPGSGHAGGSGIWQAQDYLRGGDGLGGRDYEKRGGTSGGLLGLLKSGFASFVDWFKNLVKDPLAKLSQIAGSPFGQLAAGVPKLAAEGMINKFKTFDTGGWLDPGYTLAYNGTGKRERVQTAQQAAASGRGGRVIEGTVEIMGTGGLRGYVRGVLVDEMAVAGRAV